MSQEEFSEIDFQYLMQEMRSMVKSKFNKLHDRLDRVEERAKRKQNPPSQETESRSSRRYMSKDYSLRDSYRDSYSPRNTRRRLEIATFRYDEQERTSYSSYASKKSFSKDYSRRNGREAYENIFSSFGANDYIFDSFVSTAHCKENEKEKEIKENENERKEKEKEKESEEKEKEFEREKEKEKEKEDECEIERKIEHEIENKNECEDKNQISKIKESAKQKEIERERELEKKSSEKERKFVKETSEEGNHEKERNFFANPLTKLPCEFSLFQVCKIPPTNWFQLHYLSDTRRFQLIEKGKLDDVTPFQKVKGKSVKNPFGLHSDCDMISIDQFDHLDGFRESPFKHSFCCLTLDRNVDFSLKRVLQCSNHHFPIDSRHDQMQDILLSIFQDKQGMTCENLKTSLPCSVGNKHFVDDLVLVNYLDGDLLDCSILFISDLSVLIVDKKILVFEHREFVGDKKILVFDNCVNHVNNLICGMKFPCFCKSSRMRFKGIACLNLSMLTPSLFNLCKLLEIKRLFLPIESSSQNHVFNPGICYYESLMEESKHRKCCLNECVNNLCLYDALTLCLKMRHVNFVGLLSQNKNFVSRGCLQLWSKRSELVLQDKDFELLSVLSKKSVMKLPNQLEMAKENFVFDLGERHSKSLSKVIEPWKVDFQNHSYQMPCDLGLCPSEKRVRTISIFYPGIGLPVRVVNKLSKGFFVIDRVTNWFYSFEGDKSKWFSSKEGGSINIFSSLQTRCDSNVLGNVSSRFLNKRLYDLEQFFASKWPDLRTNRFKRGRE